MPARVEQLVGQGQEDLGEQGRQAVRGGLFLGGDHRHDHGLLSGHQDAAAQAHDDAGDDDLRRVAVVEPGQDEPRGEDDESGVPDGARADRPYGPAHADAGGEGDEPGRDADEGVVGGGPAQPVGDVGNRRVEGEEDQDGLGGEERRLRHGGTEQDGGQRPAAQHAQIEYRGGGPQLHHDEHGQCGRARAHGGEYSHGTPAPVTALADSEDHQGEAAAEQQGACHVQASARGPSRGLGHAEQGRHRDDGRDDEEPERSTPSEGVQQPAGHQRGEHAEHTDRAGDGTEGHGDLAGREQVTDGGQHEDRDGTVQAADHPADDHHRIVRCEHGDEVAHQTGRGQGDHHPSFAVHVAQAYGERCGHDGRQRERQAEPGDLRGVEVLGDLWLGVRGDDARHHQQLAGPDQRHQLPDFRGGPAGGFGGGPCGAGRIGVTGRSECRGRLRRVGRSVHGRSEGRSALRHAEVSDR
nr:hypothetical protein [Streptomyces sp. ISL-12]